jgi:hypothetical protein
MSDLWGLTRQGFRLAYPESKLAMAPDKGGTMRLVGFSNNLPAGSTMWCYKGETEWRATEEHDRLTKPLLFGDDEEETPEWKG